jgi:hypothetical protein
VMDRALLETISQACCERVGSASYIIPRLHIFACSNIGLSDGQGITRDDIPSVWKGWFSIIHHTPVAHFCVFEYRIEWWTGHYSRRYPKRVKGLVQHHTSYPSLWRFPAKFDAAELH